MSDSEQIKSRYVSDINQNVHPALKNEFSPLSIGELKVWPPVVLAPMAGITNAPFRKLCKKFGAGLYVSEMVTARYLAETETEKVRKAAFAADETPRSLQLYGVDPYYVSKAVTKLVREHHVDHIDMNFGCPAKKVTKIGGGAAIPVKPNLLRSIVRAAVQHADSIPVTIKFRMGLDENYTTFLTAGKIAEEEGCAAVALHARTASQLYSGTAQWEAITELKQAVKSVPVLGNGDIWEARDALRMMRMTGCDGVVVGRGCLGRPWLFRNLADLFNGHLPHDPPDLGKTVEIMLAHLHALGDWFGEALAVKMFRKQTAWYLKGFRCVKPFHDRLVRIKSFAEVDDICHQLNPDEPFPTTHLRVARGKRRRKQKVSLPPGYLDDLDDATPPSLAGELAVSGG